MTCNGSFGRGSQIKDCVFITATADIYLAKSSLMSAMEEEEQKRMKLTADSDGWKANDFKRSMPRETRSQRTLLAIFTA